MFRHRWPIVLGVVGAVVSGPSLAQDFTQGKSPAQLFAGDCAACHKSPQGLAKSDVRSVASFLREHYTTKPEMADALAAYLLASGRGSPSNEAGRTETGRESNRNAEAPRPRGSIATGEETGEGPKSSAKLHGTGKPTDNESRHVRATAATGDGMGSTDEKDGAKPQTRAARDAGEEGAADAAKPKPRAAGREGQPGSAGRLNAYARSGTSDKDKTTDSAEARLSKLRAYANSGEAAPEISTPPKAVASPPQAAASPSPVAPGPSPVAPGPSPAAPGPSPTAANPPPIMANSPPVEPAPASPSGDSEKPAVSEEPKAPPEDATHAQSIDGPKRMIDEGSKPVKPHRPVQEGASARPVGRTDSAANVPTSPMSFLGRILSGNARQSNPN